MGLGSIFTPIAAGVALALVAPEIRGLALSTVFLGRSLSCVIGVPLGAWIGRGQGWQPAVWVMTAPSALMFIVTAWRMPPPVQAPGVVFNGPGAVLKRGDALAALSATRWRRCRPRGCISPPSSPPSPTFSHIAPSVRARTLAGGGGLAIWGALTVFGCAGVAGTLLGRAATDRFEPRRTMQVLLLSLTAMLLLLLLLTEGRPGWMLVLLLLVLLVLLVLLLLVAWGCSGFGLMSPQQARLAQMAPAQAPLLLALNSSMLYLGTALGAAIGGPAAQ